MLDRLAEWGLSIDQVVLTQTTGLETLLAGAADISTGAADESLMGLAQGADPVIIGSMESKINYVLVAKKEHKTIEDLRDGVVGISGPGGFNTLLSNMAVRSVGLEPGVDVELQQIGGSPERAAALLAGQVDAASVFLSDALELEAASDDLHVLARYADIIPEPGSSTWFSVGGFWAANPDISLAWACANLQANLWANENRSDYIDMILDRVEGTTRGPTEQMYDQAVMVDMWPVNWRDVVKTEYLENLNGMLVSTGDLEAEVDVTGVVDSSYLEAAAAGGCGAGDVPAETAAPAPAETLYDYGVTEDTIRVGAIADLSGIFAPLVIQIMDAQTAYWDMVNDNGGIDGKMVDLVVLDNGYDVPTHLDRYEAMRDKDSGVVFLSQSTGSPHTAAIAEMLVEDDLGAIPLSWYSGWPDPSFGQNVFESYTNYCYEAINAVDWLSANVVDGETKLAVISYPGEYGQDGAAGAKIAAAALGIEVVYDGEGAAIPGADQTPVITGLIESGANLVWATVGPSVFAEIFGGAAAQGFTPIWSGSSPTYNYMLLATPLAPALDAYYYQSAYALTWNAGDAPGMKTMVAELQARMPDKPLSDVYTYGWTEAMATHQILETAAKNGDMTRAGVVRAANETVIDYQGLAPDQSYGGEINDFIVRESYLFDIQADLFDVAATVADGGSTGSVMLAGGPIMSDITRDHVYEAACFSAG